MNADITDAAAPLDLGGASADDQRRDKLIVRLQHYVDHMADMHNGYGGDPQSVRDALDALLRYRATADQLQEERNRIKGNSP